MIPLLKFSMKEIIYSIFFAHRYFFKYLFQGIGNVHTVLINNAIGVMYILY